MSKIDRAIVRNIADLAKLDLSEDEIQQMTSQLSKIVDHFAVLEALDLSDIQKTVPVVGKLRDDLIDESDCTNSLLLTDLPINEKNEIIVPPILEA